MRTRQPRTPQGNVRSTFLSHSLGTPILRRMPELFYHRAMNYSLSTIRRGFRNLFDKRLAELQASKAGTYFKDNLHAIHVAIGDLPLSATGVPFKEELHATDDRHDRFGKVIYLVTEACFVYPDVDPARVTAAKEIREAFIPALEELNAPYATHGERAQDRRTMLVTYESQLKMFVVPWEPTKTLLDVATSFVTEGEKLDELLHQRASEPQALRTRAGALRAKAVGALNRLRKDLVTEIEQNPALPQDLAHKVFGFFDTLHAMEASGRGHEQVDGEDADTVEPGVEAKPG